MLFRAIGFSCWKEIVYLRFISPNNLAEGVVEIIKTNVKDHGYDAYMGLRHDHPLVVNKAIHSAKTVATMSSKLTFEVFASQNKEMSVSELFVEWEKEKLKAVPTEINGDSHTVASEITGTSPVSLPLISAAVLF